MSAITARGSSLCVIFLFSKGVMVNIFVAINALIICMTGAEVLNFWNGDTKTGWDYCSGTRRKLPVKVSCGVCHTPIAEEGPELWAAYVPLFDRDETGQTPHVFRHSCHIFWGERCVELYDSMPKWSAHKNTSKLCHSTTSPLAFSVSRLP